MLSNASASRATEEPNDRLNLGPTCLEAGLSLNTDLHDFKSNNPALMFWGFNEPGPTLLKVLIVGHLHAQWGQNNTSVSTAPEPSSSY